MAAPDYLRPTAVPKGARSAMGGYTASNFAVFNRPSVTGLLSAGLDLITALAAGGLAIRIRTFGPLESRPWEALPHMIPSSQSVFMTYVLWFGLCLVFFMRTYGLYRPMQQISGLHELRMTAHATVVAGLTLCGTLYLSYGTSISRIEILLTLTLTFILMSARRMVRRHMMYKRFRAGIETRNVLIIGAGRVAHALRNHLTSLDHLGFRFKGFVAINDEESASDDADIIGDHRNCLTLARSLFVDEIFLSVPADKKFVLGLVQEARSYGIDVRVVPDLYDGLAWNAPVEYVGQFPTIPLHRRDFPIGAYLVKRALDLTVATVALILMSPILAMIAIWVKFDSAGPVFYAAKRIGRKGRTFDCYKFRTMVTNADTLKADLEHMNERKGILFKIVNDPRVTRFGARLREVLTR